jgi:hypothetical protein
MPLLLNGARWENTGMSETTGHSPGQQARAGKRTQEPIPPASGYENPTTHQMHIVGRRRADAEAKLEQRQREAQLHPRE